MTFPNFSFESAALDEGHTIICGIDEAGRGPWAGPVVASAVILDPKNIPHGLNDSKKLNEAKREVLFDPIMQSSQVGIGIVSAAEIDEINILQATFLAMQRAFAQLKVTPQLALIDGNKSPKLNCKTQTIIGGDAKSLSIAAASIIAKVTRDRIMHQHDQTYPHYGFAHHKGYGTAAHKAALALHGPCAEHRKSFKPIALILAR
jgi:ribonuclease HII